MAFTSRYPSRFCITPQESSNADNSFSYTLKNSIPKFAYFRPQAGTLFPESYPEISFRRVYSIDCSCCLTVLSSALCLASIVVLRFFIFFEISQNMIIFAHFKSSSEAQLNFLRESSTLGYVRHYDLDRSCN